MKVQWSAIAPTVGSALGMIALCAQAQTVAPLPAGAEAVWDLDRAHTESTATRQRICINGLWLWQPADPASDRVPQSDWGWFKVPGAWPGITDYMQKDSQTVHAHPRWQGLRLGGVTAAWQQREIAIPAAWSGRRIALATETINSYAVVYLDGQRVGEMRFPAGEVDLSAVCRPGATHTLSVLVVALPLQGVRLSFNDSNAAREVKGAVARRGFCGDVHLVATPRLARIRDTTVQTSVRQGRISVGAELQDLDPRSTYVLRAEVRDGQRVVKAFASPPFRDVETVSGRVDWSAAWLPERLWDTHTPEHRHRLDVALLEGSGAVVDAAYPIDFGFREFWIDGRDFHLNGSRIFLSAVPLDNAQVSAAAATYEAARESLLRLQSLGINFVYTHNYSCQPGAHLSFAEILRAADDVGMLVALSQPHFSDYDWQPPNADATNGYAAHAAFYVRVAQHHPSVVMYAASHNATGYSDDMNPDRIDGIQDDRGDWAMNNVRRAVRAEAIIRRLDPSRIVYHHSSGNLGSMHTSNFYPNMVPIQELSDWFEHWATRGVKPFFACEYGAPFTWDWAMYRGWYKGRREFGSARVPWDFSLAEWNAQFLGPTAYDISDAERRNIRWEAERFRSGRVWQRWDYPHQLGSADFDERYPVLARYYTDAWRAFRTWGVSALSPWEHHVLFQRRPDLERNRRVDLATDWRALQRPGFSPDYLEQRYERMDLAYDRGDWIATPAAEAVMRNNRPLLAYLAGKPERFTSQDHLALPGETVAKQIVAINNARVPVVCQAVWSLDLPESLGGTVDLRLDPGEQARVPLLLPLPDGLTAGSYRLVLEARFRSAAEAVRPLDETQTDAFAIDVLPRPAPVRAPSRVALFDPLGETGALLSGLGVPFQSVGADADLAGEDVLIVGKAALTSDGPAPHLGRVADGLRVLVFEQTSQALEQRLGFRVQEHGLRQVWPCVGDHPVLAGLEAQHLRDWRGDATLVPPRLTYEPSTRYGGVPTVRWCGIEVPRLWRCGTRGSVASVLIEKPARGDFLPIAAGGFGLQYSPLLEYREGRGMVFFCQMDVTGRTEAEPAADRLVRNLLAYIADWRPAPRRQALYAGDPAGRAWLEAAGIPVGSYGGGTPDAGQVLIVAPGGGDVLAPHAPAVGAWLRAGGRLLALELDGEEANRFLPAPVRTAPTEHIAAAFAPPPVGSPCVGIGPADVHNRAPRELPLVVSGARPLGNGVVAHGEDANVVFCQLAPYRVSQAEGRSPGLEVDAGAAAEGSRSALVTVGTAPWVQLGQKVPASEVGRTVTMAALVSSLGGPVAVRLEVERAGEPWDRAARGPDTAVGADGWTELHLTFAADKPYPEGWQAYLHCAPEGARLRVDGFRLFAGTFTPAAAAGAVEGPANAFANPGFEDGVAEWSFSWPLEQQNLRRTYRRASFLVARLLANLGVAAATPLLERFGTPAGGTGGPSLLRNGDFGRLAGADGLPEHWQVSAEAPGASAALEPAPAAGGGAALRLAFPGVAEGRRGSVMLAQQDVAVQAGQWYRISLRARATGLGRNPVALALQNTATWRALFEYQRFVPEEDWREFRFQVQASATVESGTRFQIWHGQAATLWLSDLRMEPIEPPAQGRWTSGLYADAPQEWDDPYRFFRW